MIESCCVLAQHPCMFVQHLSVLIEQHHVCIKFRFQLCDFTLLLALFVKQFVAELDALRPIQSNALCQM